MSDQEQQSAEMPQDPFGYRHDYFSALNADEISTLLEGAGPADESSSTACFTLVRALGYCRVCGLDQGEEFKSEIPRSIFSAAIRQWVSFAPQIQSSIEQLSTRLDHSVDDLEEDQIVCDVLDFALESWVITVAAAPVFDEVPDDLWDTFLDQIGEMDALLDTNRDELSLAARTHWFENWRAQIIEAYSQPLPWFLDGTLEAVAAEVATQAVASMPPDYLWEACAAQNPTLQKRVVLFTPAVLPEFSEVPMIAAATADEAVPVSFSWRSPDGDYYAVLSVPKPIPAEDYRLGLAFYRIEDDLPARQWVGSIVRFGDAEAKAGDDAIAWFPATALTQQEGTVEMELRCGEPPQVWSFDTSDA